MSHWYALDGTPTYEINRKDGKGTRPTTLRDARSLKLVPSVTTVMSSVHKPGLEKWKNDQILKAAMERPFNSSFDGPDRWKQHIFLKSQEEGKMAAETGNTIHDQMELFYKGKEIDPKYEVFCMPGIGLIESSIGKVRWHAESSFAHKDGYGGKCDLHSRDSKGIILDFKTKSAENFSKVKPYDEHCVQLAAYRLGLDLPKADCYNLFISTKEPGKILLHKWSEEEVSRGEKMFYLLLEYWKLVNNFSLG